MAQILVPISDDANWPANYGANAKRFGATACTVYSNLYTFVDALDGAGIVSYCELASSAHFGTYACKLTSASDPGVDTSFYLTLQVKALGTLESTQDFIVFLYQANSDGPAVDPATKLIWSWDFRKTGSTPATNNNGDSYANLTTSYQTLQYEISATPKGIALGTVGITDFTALWLYFQEDGTASAPFTTHGVQVAFVKLDIPDLEQDIVESDYDDALVIGWEPNRGTYAAVDEVDITYSAGGAATDPSYEAGESGTDPSYSEVTE